MLKKSSHIPCWVSLGTVVLVLSRAYLGTERRSPSLKFSPIFPPTTDTHFLVLPGGANPDALQVSVYRFIATGEWLTRVVGMSQKQSIWESYNRTSWGSTEMAKMWKGTTVYHVLDLNLGSLLYILYNLIDRFILGFPSFPEIQVQCKATANWGWRLRVYLEPIRLRIQTLIANKYCWTSPLLSSTIPAEQQKAHLPPLVHIQLAVPHYAVFLLDVFPSPPQSHQRPTRIPSWHHLLGLLAADFLRCLDWTRRSQESSALRNWWMNSSPKKHDKDMCKTNLNAPFASRFD